MEMLPLNSHLSSGVLLLVVILLNYTGRYDGSNIAWTGRGTTANLEEIVIGRCNDYIGLKNPAAGKKNCTLLWQTLKSVFASKDPCKITQDDYKPFLTMAEHDIPSGKSIFWSQTGELTRQYADIVKNVMPLESTLTGYMMNGLNWCGQRSSSELNYEVCPAWNECEENAAKSFWRSASVVYAKKASGEVKVVLNGSSQTRAFRTESIFGSIELGNLDTNRISSIQLWIMDNLSGSDKESCGVGSIAQLEIALKHKGFKFSCIDNYSIFRSGVCKEELDTWGTADLPGSDNSDYPNHCRGLIPF
eukprot:gi/632943875/ref/XP_007887195.1/ PREDICTED: ADP-ribosyl cyclase 2-like isoform X1 [Callorhinchus milii]